MPDLIRESSVLTSDQANEEQIRPGGNGSISFFLMETAD